MFKHVCVRRVAHTIKQEKKKSMKVPTLNKLRENQISKKKSSKIIERKQKGKMATQIRS